MAAGDPIVGIDLGTTNSAVAFAKNGVAEIIRGDSSKSTMPSLVHLGEPEVVGEGALPLLESAPQSTIYGSKRLMGRKMLDVQEYANMLPYKTFAKCNGDVWIKGDFGKLAPAQIGAKILKKLRGIAEKALGRPVSRAVVTVPAYFDDSQRQATRNAGKIAGLDVLRIINEPTAAALAYGMDKKAQGNIAVYDLGGGTFDISILELSNGVFHVKATAGDTFLGGDDFDSEIVKFLVTRLETEEGIDVDLDGDAGAAIRAKLRLAAEAAKKALSTKEQTKVFVENVVDGHDLDIVLKRTQLENVVKRIAERTREPCERALKDSRLRRADIKHVILVGGMTRMPAVRQLVADIFGVEPSTDVNPDEAVALGAAVQAGILAGSVDDVLLLDVTPLSLGIEVLGGIFSKVVDRNTTIPCKHTEVFSTSEDNQTEVDIRIFQGERAMAADNRLLGSVKLENIPRAPRGTPQIAVSFEVDANGCINVSAEDSVSKKPAVVKLVLDSGLTKTQVDRLVKEAEDNRKADALRESRTKFSIENRPYVKSLLNIKLPAEVELKARRLGEIIEKESFDVAEATALLAELKKLV
ncbi:molecular chaperone DnaK [Pancytospora philotis]|nr:molecular chaperone DnaK [Pancytospora philotis]